jgi:hypothetical protein
MGDVQSLGIDFVMRRGGAGSPRPTTSVPKTDSLLALQRIGVRPAGNIECVFSRRHQCGAASDPSAAGSLDRSRRNVDMPRVLRESCIEHQQSKKHMPSGGSTARSATNLLQTLADCNEMVGLVGVSPRGKCVGKSSPPWGAGPGLRAAVPSADTQLPPSSSCRTAHLSADETADSIHALGCSVRDAILKSGITSSGHVRRPQPGRSFPRTHDNGTVAKQNETRECSTGMLCNRAFSCQTLCLDECATCDTKRLPSLPGSNCSTEVDECDDSTVDDLDEFLQPTDTASSTSEVSEDTQAATECSSHAVPSRDSKATEGAAYRRTNSSNTSKPTSSYETRLRRQVANEQRRSIKLISNIA